jgi:hypothetical protein
MTARVRLESHFVLSTNHRTAGVDSPFESTTVKIERHHDAFVRDALKTMV